MKPVLPALALLAAGAFPALADCDLDAISKALEAPLGKLKRIERDVTETQSTEGGIFEVYREKDGRVHTVSRTDFGESGKNETRLSAVSRKTWGIASTRFDYIRHAFAENGGPFGNARKTTSYYYFCDGKLFQPPPDWNMTGEEYAKEAEAARKVILDAPEVADFTRGLAR